MFKNYLKAAFRSLFRYKFYTFINVFGLAIGLASVMLIALYVNQELSFDQFHQYENRIFRVNLDEVFEGEAESIALTPSTLFPTFKQEFPEIENGVRIYPSTGVLSFEEKLFQEKDFFFVDSTFFQVFSFPLLKGNPDKVLEAPFQIVISESAAKRYFGDEDPLNKVLMRNKREYKVTGVMKDFPPNSHFNAEFVASFNTLDASKSEGWSPANYHTYLLLNSEAAAERLQPKIKAFTDRVLAEDNQNGNSLSYSLFPLADIHLRSNLDYEISPGGNLTYLYIFSIIAILILVVACINYMNLATARAADRAKEVGLRKVLGAQRKQLFFQFTGEAVLITSIALAFSYFIAHLSLPILNDLTNSKMLYEVLFTPQAIAVAFFVVLMVGFISGSYPALVLSGFQPIKVLKGKFSRSGKGSMVRKALVVFQFAVSTMLIASTLVVYDQLQFIQNKELGYNQEQLMSMKISWDAIKNYEAIKTALKRVPGVEEMSLSTETLTEINGGYSIWVEGKEQGYNFPVTAMPTDNDFIKTTGVQLVSGNDFTPTQMKLALPENREERVTAFMINEFAAKKLGFTAEEIVGKKAIMNGRKGEIVAVMKDFHFASLAKEIEPLVVFLERSYSRTVMVKVSTDNLENTLAGIKATWAQLVPYVPFDYQFLSDEFSAMYNSEKNTANIFTIFSSVAIFIACLGLLGLISFMAIQRAKEISIRKVLGASVFNVISLITSDFAKLLGISFLIATPTVYFIMNEWLNGFAYRTTIGAQVVGITMTLSVLIAFATISYQAIKAATANPINSLKEE